MENEQLQTTSTHDTQLPDSAPQNQPANQDVKILVPQMAENYDFISEIGKGTQGRVFKARRMSDGQTVAVKELNIASVSNWKAYELFHREVEILSDLNINGVAKFYEAKEYLEAKKPAAYLVQEYIEGRTLEQMLSSGYRFTINRIFEMMIQLLTILKELHFHNPEVIHRDIKPSNIIMKPLGGDTFKVYLIDFGAVANPQVQHGGSTVAGTVGYMPPEQLMGNPVAASDIYALAALCVQLLSGVSPADMKIADYHLVFEPHIENLPNSIKAVLRNMLEPNLSLRLSDHDSLIQTFSDFAKGRFGTPQKLSFFASFIQSADFSKQLQNVEALCEPGTFDLWQKLSEDCPRFVPTCWIKYINNRHYLEAFEREYFVYKVNNSSTSIDKLNKKAKFNFKVILNDCLMNYKKYTGIFLVIFCIINYLSIFLITIHKLFEFAFISGIFMFFLIGFSQQDSIKNKNKLLSLQHNKSKKTYIELEHYQNVSYNIFVSRTMNNYPLSEYPAHCLKDLLSNGKKAIATILSYEFVKETHHIYAPKCPSSLGSSTLKSNLNITLKNFLFEEDDELDNLASNPEIYTMSIVNTPPTFKIRYKFNPPDDSNTEDLIHEVYVHFNPAKWCKPGTPIPILYDIEHYDDNLEIVRSMPFPFPLFEIKSPDEIYCGTINLVREMDYSRY